MPISSSDLLFKYSVVTGSAGNSTAQADPDDSLGKYISTTQWTGGSLNDLFDDITGDENAASQVDYRCIFIHNNHGSLTLLSPKLWIASEVSGGANIALGVDTIASSAVGASSAQGLLIASTTVAPVGVSFSSPTNKASGLSLGDIPAGQVKAFWFRRTATNSAALNNDGVTVQIEGDTTA